MNKYLITGATGYIGSMIMERCFQKGAEVSALVRNSVRPLPERWDGADIIEADITDEHAMGSIKESFDYIIHCAAPTKSSYMISNPVETTDAIVNGTRNVLDLARRCRTKKVVYLSSMEVYGHIDCSGGRRICEEELGDIDIFNVRSCYPLGKRMAENLCYSYYEEYGVPVVIARLAQTFGRGILAGETRIFAQIARSIKAGQDIVLHTQGNSMGNYCGIDDVLDAISVLLERGKAGQAYNVVNEDNTMSIRAMAELAAEKLSDSRVKVVIDVPDNSMGYAPDTGLRLSGEKMRKLGWQPRMSLIDMYRQITG